MIKQPVVAVAAVAAVVVLPRSLQDRSLKLATCVSKGRLFSLPTVRVSHIVERTVF